MAAVVDGSVAACSKSVCCQTRHGGEGTLSVCETRWVGLSGAVASLVSSVSRVTLQGTGRFLRAFLMIRPRARRRRSGARSWLNQEPVRLVGPPPPVENAGAARTPARSGSVPLPISASSCDVPAILAASRFSGSRTIADVWRGRTAVAALYLMCRIQTPADWSGGGCGRGLIVHG